MERLIFLMILAITQSSPLMSEQGLLQQKNPQQACASLLNFNNLFYLYDHTINVTGVPADMTVHWKTDRIFFTLISEQMKMGLRVLQPNGEIETIQTAGLGQSTCVDNLNDVVYLATDNGVYKYKDDGSIEPYAGSGEDVMYIAVDRDAVMYIATWPNNHVYMISNDGQRMQNFPAIPNGHGLTVDTEGNMFFVATKTSYLLKNGNTTPVKITGLPDEEMAGILVSRTGDVYAMDDSSNLYLIDVEHFSARLLGSFNVTGVNTFAMDVDDNVLIGVRGGIMKFSAYKKNPCL